MTEEKDISRRAVIGLGVTAAAAIAAGAVLSSGEEEPTVRVTKIPTAQPLAKPLPSIEIPPSPELIKHQKLQAILNAGCLSNHRAELESEYALEASTRDEIIRGIWVTQKQEVRKYLMDKLWELRQTGDERETGLKKLSDAHIRWATKEGISPEVLATCKQAYDERKPQGAIQILLPQIKPDLKSNPNAELFMLSAGGFAKLIQLETNGFLNVGTEQAASQMPDMHSREALWELCRLVSIDTGLNFNPTTIVGSEHYNGAVRGGAIGAQTTPEVAIELHKYCKSIGIKFNPFDLNSIIIGGSIQIARDRGVAGPGYVMGQEEEQKSGLRNWFGPEEKAIEGVLKAESDYRDRIILTNVSRN